MNIKDSLTHGFTADVGDVIKAIDLEKVDYDKFSAFYLNDSVAWDGPVDSVESLIEDIRRHYAEVDIISRDNLTLLIE